MTQTDTSTDTGPVAGADPGTDHDSNHDSNHDSCPGVAASPEVDTVRQAYDRMASWNSHLLDHDRFDTWIALFGDLIDSHKPAGRRLLDIGCGAGRSSVAFAAMGYDVTAYDLSPRMIEQATTRPGAEAVRFLVGDLRDPPAEGPFDVAVCFNEAFVHLVNEAELTAAFRRIADTLTPDGVLVFDMATAAQVRSWYEAPNVRELPDFELAVWSDPSDFAPDTPLTLHLRWFVPAGDLWRREAVDLTCQHFAMATVRRALANAGLTPLRVAGIADDRLIDEPGEDDPVKACYLVGRRTG